jgi:hypothetical protein
VLTTKRPAYPYGGLPRLTQESVVAAGYWEELERSARQPVQGEEDPFAHPDSEMVSPSVGHRSHGWPVALRIDFH